MKALRQVVFCETGCKGCYADAIGPDVEVSVLPQTCIKVKFVAAGIAVR